MSPLSFAPSLFQDCQCNKTWNLSVYWIKLKYEVRMNFVFELMPNYVHYLEDTYEATVMDAWYKDNGLGLSDAVRRVFCNMVKDETEEDMEETSQESEKDCIGLELLKEWDSVENSPRFQLLLQDNAQGTCWRLLAAGGNIMSHKVKNLPETSFPPSKVKFWICISVSFSTTSRQCFELGFQIFSRHLL